MLNDCQVIARPHRSVPLGNGRFLCISGVGPVLFGALERKLLESLFRPGNAGAQARGVAVSLGVPEDQSRLALERLLALAIVVPTSHLAACCRPEAPEPTLPSAVLATISRDHPSDLATCAASFLTNAREFGRTPELVVVDGSSPAAAAANLAALAGLTDFRGQIRYCGATEREAFILRLAARTGQRAVADLALQPRAGVPSYGAARNLLVLDCLGDLVISVDDDMRAATAVHPNRSEGITLGGHEPPFDYWLFARREEALAAARWTERDFMGDHLALLGRHVGSCLVDPIKLASPCAHLLDVGRDARVAATVCGKVGGAGRPGRVWADRILADRGEPAPLPASADGEIEIVEAADAATIAHCFGCMAGVLGLDLRHAVPPFPPCYRSEDAVFADLLDRSCPEAFWGIPAHAVLHSRATPAQAGDSNMQVAHCSFLLALASALRADIGSQPGTFLGLFGQWLAELGALNPAEMQRAALPAAAAHQAAIAVDLARLARTDACTERRPRWHRLREAALAEIERLAAPVASDTSRRAAAPSWDSYSGYFKEYGRILIGWGDLLRAARALRAEGGRASLLLG